MPLYLAFEFRDLWSINQNAYHEVQSDQGLIWVNKQLEPYVSVVLEDKRRHTENKGERNKVWTQI